MNGTISKDLNLNNLNLQNLLTGCTQTTVKTVLLQACRATIADATIDNQCATFPQGVCTPTLSGASPINVQDDLIINQQLIIPSGATAGYVLTADSEGSASWQPASSGGNLVNGTVTNAQPGGTTVSNVVCQRVGQVAVLQFDWVQTVAGGPYAMITFDDPSFFPNTNMLIIGFRDNMMGADNQEFRCQLRTSGDVFLPFFSTTTGGDTVSFIATYFTV